jgi:hypothetical protein
MNANINCLTQTKSRSLATINNPGKFQPRGETNAAAGCDWLGLAGSTHAPSYQIDTEDRRANAGH